MYNLGNDIWTSDHQVWSTNNRYSTQLLYVVVSKSGRAVARYWLVCLAVVKDRTFLRDPSRDAVGPPHPCAIHPSTHVREGPAQVDFCSARNLVYIWSVVLVYTSKSVWDQTPATLKYDRPQRDRPATYVLLPSSILLPPSFRCAFIHARIKPARYSEILFHFSYCFKNCVSLKLNNFKFLKLGTVTTTVCRYSLLSYAVALLTLIHHFVT